MVGGHLKYRHLSRSSAHRQALLRNLVTSLLEHETIKTTWHKAKEAQRLAEKLITLGKKNSNASRTRAQQILFTPLKHMNKLFGELRLRYADRPGGYTRVLHIEPINNNNDQAASAILELVDGPKDMRFAMTARSLVRERAAAAQDEEKGIRDITARNIRKVTRFRTDGEQALLNEVERIESEEQKNLDTTQTRRREAETEREDKMKKYKQDKDTWDARSRKERRDMLEPKEPEDNWDESEFETRPRREGWEPYKFDAETRRSRRRQKEWEAERAKRTKRPS